ncbi:MAG: nucleoside hydrolase [Clostridia bacterium]|nr:nucleoside hydrolase [Clostridia bacterium]
MEKVIFDLDIGVDDAMALIMGINDPEVDIKLVTTVFGNVSVEQATKNACYIIEQCAKTDIPVFFGASKGLKTEGINAMDVHGRTGLGTKVVAENVSKYPLNTSSYGAVEAMRDMIFRYPNEITILSVGPVTNLATLFVKYPEVKDKIKRVGIEVGSVDGKGSITPYSSFNAYCDPEAVDIVIKSGVPITLTTKEIGTSAFFDEEQRTRFKNAGRVGPLLYDLCEGYKDKLLEPGHYAVHDTCVLFAILKTDIFTRQNVDMVINTTNDEKRGQTKFKNNDNSHITLVTSVDKKKLFKKMENNIKLS